jgi:hypothetical protein
MPLFLPFAGNVFLLDSTSSENVSDRQPGTLSHSPRQKVRDGDRQRKVIQSKGMKSAIIFIECACKVALNLVAPCRS